jgi:hypothetical protein
LVRLASDFQYRDVYEDGCDILDPGWETTPDGKPTGNKLDSRSIIIFRYYDTASTILGTGDTPDISTSAEQLGDLVLRVRDLVCRNKANRVTPDAFRCYLVAHSMGGLICRAFLQNPKIDRNHAGKYVEKVFTYATPHNGIEFAGMNVPSWLTAGKIANFNRETMAKYLNLEGTFKKTGRVDWLPEDRFPSHKFFCMVGTNRTDYGAALGLSRTFVGHGSDGLVKIENATLRGLGADGKPGDECAKAFTFRSHSGFFGIVNSEEAYQNLKRFLFGDVRVDVWIDVDDISLPDVVQKEADKGRKVDALYQFEVLAGTRGKLWSLTRRVSEEDSVACLSHAEWTKAPKANRSQYVSTVFLATIERVNKNRASLAYSVTVGVRVPDYEVAGALWTKEHYEGAYLIRRTIVIELWRPTGTSKAWKVKYAWQTDGVSKADQDFDPEDIEKGKVEMSIPLESDTKPGIKGRLRFVISGWNLDRRQDE